MKELYKVLIVEDFEDQRNELVRLLSFRTECKCIDTAADGEEAYHKLSINKYDLALIDINLPVLSGVEVLEKLDKRPFFIFTTAYDSYTIKAFEIGAIDYLLKPIMEDRLNVALDRAIDRIKNNKIQSFPIKRCFTFKENRRQKIIPEEKIIFVSSSNKNVIIHTDEKDFFPALQLKDVESRLPGDIFTRIHKQHIVNLHFITGIKSDDGSQYIITLGDIDENILPVGKGYVISLKEKLRNISH
jgi:DNA-binding LytR/AlgR family response regulator